MVKITKKFSGGGDPKQWAEGIINKIETGNRAALNDTIREGASTMKEYIASRPTAWMAANAGKTGRIESRDMLNAVGSTVRVSSDDKWSGAFGWVGEQQPYFLVQEEGGRNTFTGGSIEAMYAKSDAAAEMWDRLTAEIEGNLRGA